MTSPLRTSDTFKIAAALFALYLLAQLLWFANALVIASFLGVLAGLAVNAGVQPLLRFRVPRGVAAVTVVLLGLLLIFGVGAAVAPAIRTQTVELKARMPESLDRVTQWLTEHGLRAEPPTDSAGIAKAAEAKRQTAQRLATEGTRLAFSFLSQTVAVVGGLFLIVFLAIYIGANPEEYKRGVTLLFPPHARARCNAILTEIASVLRRWLATQLIAMIAIGVLSTTALLVLRVQSAFALGLLAALLEFVPTVGPLLSALPAIAMALVDSPEKALAVAAAYAGIQFVENNILIPLLMKDGVDVPPVLTIVTQALLTLLFGFLGLMVAVPLLAAGLVAYRMLFIEPEPDLVLDEAPVSPAASG